MFIKEIIDYASKVVLITRPWRFGKTLNISLLKYYFEKTENDKSYLFKNFNIWNQGKKYLNEFSKYPVINLTLKNAKNFIFDISPFSRSLLIWRLLRPNSLSSDVFNIPPCFSNSSIAFCLYIMHAPLYPHLNFIAYIQVHYITI
jgi:hypothetical protein